MTTVTENLTTDQKLLLDRVMYILLGWDGGNTIQRRELIAEAIVKHDSKNS